MLSSPEYTLSIPALCVAEATYLIGSRAGAQMEGLFLRGLEPFDVQAPLSQEWSGIAQLVEEYADSRLGGTDASVIALAERYDTDLVITLDKRRFRAVRPRQ